MLRGCHACNCQLQPQPRGQLWAPRSARGLPLLEGAQAEDSLLPPHLPDRGPLLGLSPPRGDGSGDGWGPRWGPQQTPVPQQGRLAGQGRTHRGPGRRGQQQGHEREQLHLGLRERSGWSGRGRAGAAPLQPRPPTAALRAGGASSSSRPAQVAGDPQREDRGKPLRPCGARERGRPVYTGFWTCERSSSRGLRGKRGRLKTLPC